MLDLRQHPRAGASQSCLGSRQHPVSARTLDSPAGTAACLPTGADPAVQRAPICGGDARVRHAYACDFPC